MVLLGDRDGVTARCCCVLGRACRSNSLVVGREAHDSERIGSIGLE